MGVAGGGRRGVHVTQRRRLVKTETEKKVQRRERRMIRITLMALLGSNLTKALVVHARINGSAVNFLPCDPTISNCDNLKDNLIGCDLEACKATTPDGRTAPTPAGKCCPDPFLCDQERECASKEEFCKPEFCPNGELAPVPEGKCCPSRDLCPLQHCQGISCPPKRCATGDLAPIPRNSCCPSKAECDNKNCSQVRCIVERCSDGSIAPVPKGQCCPSKRACPTQAYSLESSYSKGGDCSEVTCYLARCPGSNIVAPVPWGNCCPNIGLCPLTHRSFEDEQKPSSPDFQQSIESF